MSSIALLFLATPTPLPQRNASPDSQESPSIEIRVDGKSSVARVWSEDGRHYYAVSLDGRTFQPARETSYELALRFDEFDPLERNAAIPVDLRSLTAPPSSRLFIVQYWTQGLEDYREVLRERGVQIHRFLANHANIVEMDPAIASEVRALSFVRAVRPFHPAYKLEEELIEGVRRGDSGPLTLNLLTMLRGGHAPVVEWIEDVGGVVEEISRETYLMTATIERTLLPELASLDAVQWIDRWSAPEADMNIARQMHGADYIENTLSYRGQGVRGEVLDLGFDNTHPDLPPSHHILHNNGVIHSHGTATSGIVFGQGRANRNARGILPEGFLVVARAAPGTWAGGSRYAHTAELQDPTLPYRCVFQTNSWGSAQSTAYGATSQNLDQILFDLPRLSILQSQSNLGSRRSRPEAWAKNIISVGGVSHYDNLDKSDDSWTSASTGPAADGRIKPDLASFYDSVLTTAPGRSYTSTFNGTSAATPIIAGHLGLFYQMWSEGLFGNRTPGGGGTVFDDRPNNTTAKAVLINTASQWNFSGGGHNLRRVRQGWGHADLQNMAEQAGSMLVVDESEVLAPFASKSYSLTVAAGSPFFRATMVYRDPPGTTSANLHRINDLDLTVVSPDGSVFKGNRGLLTEMNSSPDGDWNSVDTVENVFTTNPTPGVWQVIVSATEVNQDTHLETPSLDVDFALAVSGIESGSWGCRTAEVHTRSAPGNVDSFSASAPRLGHRLFFDVDSGAFPLVTIVGAARPDAWVLPAGGTALVNVVDGAPLFWIGPLPGPRARASFVLPDDPSLCGSVLYTQAKLHGNGAPFGVTNSQDLILGH